MTTIEDWLRNVSLTDTRNVSLQTIVFSLLLMVRIENSKYTRGRSLSLQGWMLLALNIATRGMNRRAQFTAYPTSNTQVLILPPSHTPPSFFSPLKT